MIIINGNTSTGKLVILGGETTKIIKKLAAKANSTFEEYFAEILKSHLNKNFFFPSDEGGVNNG